MPSQQRRSLLQRCRRVRCGARHAVVRLAHSGSTRRSRASLLRCELRLASARTQVPRHVRAPPDEPTHPRNGAAAQLDSAQETHRPSCGRGGRATTCWSVNIRGTCSQQPRRCRTASARTMKFAFIAPRYGAEISSDGDHACRLLAEQVSARHDVDVLTTCSREPGSWKNDYTEGADRVRGALVRRFAVSQAPDRSGLAALSRRLQVDPPSRTDELEWVRLQGPSSPGLVDYLKRQHRSYDVLVFFGLMHPLSVQGIDIAPERTVIFPYLRLQPELRFGLWRDL